MKSLQEFDATLTREIDFVLSDLDDTLTDSGHLRGATYAALEKLKAAGKRIVIVTGRPAGWCDMIARFWPVDGVVGENGAFYFRYDHDKAVMVRHFLQSEEERARNHKALFGFFDDVRNAHPDIRLSADQAFRVSDIAIDICEDVQRLGKDEVADIVARLAALGATVKVSSIHINAWIGHFDKLTMIRSFLKTEFDVDAEAAKQRVVYVGDSPNDEPMFGYFPHSVGVANVEEFLPDMVSKPAYVARGRGGVGFVELANLLIPAGKPAISRGNNRRSSSPARR
jgi:HAD superfamily hydrolase (TIGR01484 family)